jgi:LuxR family maltose regulon positive regulatory protein
MPERPTPIAKITRPRIRGVFPRERLFALLEETRKYPVTWISAPAGSGKTTLAASFIETNKIPCLWYQVDEGDADIATFFNYLGMAAKKAAPQKRKPLPLFTPEYLQGISTFTLRYFENLFSRFKPPSILVLDNFQTVTTESDFHEVINKGISTIPDGINAFIISRHDLPSPLSGLRANGLMKMLGWEDLRLTLEETTGIVPLKTQEIPSKDVIRQLHQAADGWVAGLVLMLEGMKRGVEPHLFGKMAPEEIIDYFGNEFFNKTDKEIQNFLLQAAFLPKITIKAAEKLTGLSNAKSILSALSRNNYFTERHYSSEPVYQFHPLYREFLMARARETFSHEALSTSLHQAAILLEQDGQTEAAVSLLREIGDWKAMAGLVLVHAPDMLKQGRHHPLLEWLESLPATLPDANPWLFYWKGMSILPFSPAQARFAFERSFAGFQAGGDTFGAILAASCVVNAIFYSDDNYNLLDHWYNVLIGLVAHIGQFPNEEMEASVIAAMITASRMGNISHPEAETWAKRALEIAELPPTITFKVNAIISLFLHRLIYTSVPEALPLLVRLQQLSRYPFAQPFSSLIFWSAQTYYNLFSGLHREMIAAVNEGLKISRETGAHFADGFFYIHAAMGLIDRLDLKGAEGWMEKMSPGVEQLSNGERAFYHIHLARIAFIRKDLDQASYEGKLALEHAEKIQYGLTLAVARLMLAQISHRMGRRKEALEYLEQGRQYALKADCRYISMVVSLSEAQFALEGGDHDQDCKLMRQAFGLAREGGYVVGVIDDPTVTVKMCQKALEEGIETEHVRTIIRRRGLVPETPPLHLENWPWPVEISVLGRFELFKEGQPVEFNRKVQKKPLLMVKAMIALGGRNIDEERLMDIIWPEADGDQAYSALTTTLSRLRQLLGEKVLEVQAGRVSLSPSYCWVDVWAFEDLADKAEGLWRGSHSGDGRANALQLMGKAVDLYQGSFLGDEGSKLFWALPLGERLKNRFLFLIEKLGRSLELKEQWEQAIVLYRKGLEVDNLTEELYRRLMVCYGSIGETVKAAQVYLQLKTPLSSSMGIDPSPKTETLYRTLTSPLKIKKK